MLGPPKSRRLHEPILVSLDDLVPEEHFYRHLEAKLDLSFVRDWSRELYAVRGRPSIDPVVFFKLQLIMFFEGIRSERQLVEIASLQLAHRWYLGYALDESLPDHSSLTRIRERLGLPIFRRFFERVVELCRQAGLVWGQEVLADASKVRGNAAMNSLVPRLAEVVDGHLVPLFGAEVKVEETEPGVAGEAPRLLHPEMAVVEPAEIGDRKRRWDLLEECRLDPDRPLSPGYQRLSARKVSRTDPDATPMTMADKRVALGYQVHYLVDGGKARIILHALVTPADVMENQPLLDQLRRTIFRWRLRPTRLIADTTYGTIENIRALEEQGILAFVPLPDWEQTTPYYGPGRFAYDAERDVHVCPQGAVLHPVRREFKAQKTEYRADAATCKGCSVKAECTPSNHGRQVHRSFHAEHLERVRGRHQTPAFAKAMRKRRVWLEPLFAEAKQWHGLERFRLRGLPNVNIASLLVASGQNLKRWLQATGWGRRSWPSAVALHPPALP